MNAFPAHYLHEFDAYERERGMELAREKKRKREKETQIGVWTSKDFFFLNKRKIEIEKKNTSKLLCQRVHVLHLYTQKQETYHKAQVEIIIDGMVGIRADKTRGTNTTMKMAEIRGSPHH